MLELLPLIALLLTPLWGWLLWRRMKAVQRIANEQARPPERHNIDAFEDEVRREDGLTLKRPMAFDDDLALAEKRASGATDQKNLEGRRH